MCSNHKDHEPEPEPPPPKKTPQVSAMLLDSLPQDDDRSPLLDVLRSDAVGDVVGSIATEKQNGFGHTCSLISL